MNRWTESKQVSQMSQVQLAKSSGQKVKISICDTLAVTQAGEYNLLVPLWMTLSSESELLRTALNEHVLVRCERTSMNIDEWISADGISRLGWTVRPRLDRVFTLADVFDSNCSYLTLINLLPSDSEAPTAGAACCSPVWTCHFNGITFVSLSNLALESSPLIECV